jgi:hypothetical protein
MAFGSCNPNPNSQCFPHTSSRYVDSGTFSTLWQLSGKLLGFIIIINGDVDCSPREATFCHVRGRKDRRVRAWTFIFILIWICSFESFVTEDGLRVYNIQLWIFLFVTSKSKETLWLCVLGLIWIIKCIQSWGSKIKRSQPISAYGWMMADAAKLQRAELPNFYLYQHIPYSIMQPHCSLVL